VEGDKAGVCVCAEILLDIPAEARDAQHFKRLNECRKPAKNVHLERLKVMHFGP
jgi:hypothetical protein